MLAFRPRPKTLGVMLHASHTDPRLPHVENHLAVKGRTMGLLEVGYHFLILPDGKLITTRPVDTMGTHAFGFNHDHIGVCLAGGAVRVYDSLMGGELWHEDPANNFTPAQGETLKGLMDFIWSRYPGIPLVGHSEKRKGHPRQCPPMDMNEVREWVK